MCVRGVGKLPESVRVYVRGYIGVGLCCSLIVCCFIVAMPSGKRETEKKGNTPVNTGPSPNSDGRANTQVEEADEPARGSGPLHFKL
ncbi:hypothetical protein T12_11947 [Trichinella patagoniensis]|uniref:Uncharacterized protein n=1 Tax=Trichinella patagoniensis TaxID=990121 RepID=A0A0V0ZKU9_9BILA|nr:hypothetical protein T12_11947 [Trichinella patagoniensis]